MQGAACPNSILVLFSVAQNAYNIQFFTSGRYFEIVFLIANRNTIFNMTGGKLVYSQFWI